MKSCFSLVIALVGFIQSIAQYQPFPEKDAFWVVDFNEVRNIGTPSTYTYTSGKIYEPQGDTLISGQQYIRMYCSSLGHKQYFYKNTKEQVSAGFQYVYAYRNDAANKKVYIVYRDSVVEHLWLDFNVQVGDTLDTAATAFKPRWTGSDFFLNIESSSFEKICGDDHKKYHFKDCGGGDVTLIEGMGFSSDFQQYNSECNTLFESWHSSRLYKGVCMDDFWPLLTSDGETQKREVQIYPNPTRNQLNLSGVASGAKVEIFDLIGNLIMTEVCDGKALNVSNLPQGLYLMTVEEPTQKRTTISFMKAED